MFLVLIVHAKANLYPMSLRGKGGFDRPLSAACSAEPKGTIEPMLSPSNGAVWARGAERAREPMAHQYSCSVHRI